MSRIMYRVSNAAPAAAICLALALCASAATGAEGKAKRALVVAPAEAPVEKRGKATAAFAQQPKVARVSAGRKISFEVKDFTDAEVAVLDAGGKVVRHLAAGLLGGNAPQPFRAGSRRQEIVWDGRDDRGRDALGGEGDWKKPFSFRVRLGATPRKEKIAGWNGNTFGRAIAGLTVGPGGEVFVLLANTPRGRSEVRVLDKRGRYLRTIMPCSAKTPVARRSSLGTVRADGEQLPLVYHFQSTNTAPLTGGMRRQNMVYNSRGFLVMVSAGGSLKEQGGPRHLLGLHPQGGAVPPMNFVGPRIAQPLGRPYSAGTSRTAYFDHLAASPDGRWIYVTLSARTSPHCVFRVDANTWPGRPGAPVETLSSGMEEGFVGRVNMPGSEKGRLNDPQGLAVDAKGNLYVCDRGNDRVVVFSPKAGKLAEFAVGSPEQIGVHRKTGKIYVLSRPRLHGRALRDFDEMSMKEYKAWLAREAARREEEGPAGPVRLLVFSALGEKPIARLAAVEAPLHIMALDPESSPARIWASTTRRRRGVGRSETLRFPELPTRGELISITDRGDRLELGEPVSNEKGLRYPWFVSADPKGGRVLIREDAPYPPWPQQVAGRGEYKAIVSLDLESDRIRPFLHASEAEFGPDGSVYAMGRPYGSSAIHRYDGKGEPLAFPGSKSNRMKTRYYRIISNNQIGARGFTVAPSGDIYLIRSNKGRPEKGVYSRVDVYSPGGKLKRAALVDGLGAADCGIGVDAAGNVYFGANLKKRGEPFPAGVGPGLPTSTWIGWKGANDRPKPWLYCCANYYLFAWGSVFKFGPEGGSFYGRLYGRAKPRPGAADPARLESAPGGAGEYVTGCLKHTVAVSGAKWRFFGASPVPSDDLAEGDVTCICVSSRLAVDPFGRVFVPDAYRFSVWMLDTGGNLLSRIGSYGNVDDARAGEGLHFAWPSFVDACNGRLFVTDGTNRLVAVVRIDYGAEAVCAVE